MPIPVCNGDKVCGGIVIGDNLNDIDNLSTEPITLSPVPAPYFSESVGGGSDADTLNGQAGSYYLDLANSTGDLDDIADGTTYVKISATNHTDLTDGGTTNLHVHTESFGIAIGPNGSDATAGLAKGYFDVPYAITLVEVYGTLATAATGSNFIIDINEAGVSIMTDRIVIEAGEISSKTATTQPSLADTSIAAGARLTFDIDQVGASTAGQEPVVFLIGYRTI